MRVVLGLLGVGSLGVARGIQRDLVLERPSSKSRQSDRRA